VTSFSGILWAAAMPTYVSVEPAHAAGLIGDLFLERGLISVDQLDAALEEQRASGRS